MLESRMRQELIAVQVRCDRLAREVQRIGALSVLALAQLLPVRLSIAELCPSYCSLPFEVAHRRGRP